VGYSSVVNAVGGLIFTLKINASMAGWDNSQPRQHQNNLTTWSGQRLLIQQCATVYWLCCCGFMKTTRLAFL